MEKKIVLCADSTCDLSPELKERYHVHCFPFHVILEDKTYGDGYDLMPDQIYEVYRARKVLPKTAAINMAEYAEFCQQWLGEDCDVIYITIGSGLSAAFNNCRMAAEGLPGMYAVDSRNLSSGTGLLVIAAAERIAAGLPAAQIAQELNELTAHVESSFIIDTLENGEIRTFYERQWYPECLYLLAMLDHISKLNDIPLCSDFDDLRRYKQSRVIYPRDVLLLCALFHNDDAMRQAEEDAIPEFRQYNIIESDIRNVV